MLGAAARFLEPRLIVFRRSSVRIGAREIQGADPARARRAIRPGCGLLSGAFTAAIIVNRHASELTDCIVQVIRWVGPKLTVLTKVLRVEDRGLCGCRDRQQ